MALDKVFDGEGHIFGTELSQYALETAVNRIGRDLLNKRFTLIRVKDLFNLQQFNILFLGRLEYTIICPFLQIGSMEFFMLMCVLVGLYRIILITPLLIILVDLHLFLSRTIY